MRGATQVKVTAGASPFCIDSTEATNAQYPQFVASWDITSDAGGCPARRGQCGTVPEVTEHHPERNWPNQPGHERQPRHQRQLVPGVRFLRVGRESTSAGEWIGGGPLLPSDDSSRRNPQWYNACSPGRHAEVPVWEKLQLGRVRWPGRGYLLCAAGWDEPPMRGPGPRALRYERQRLGVDGRLRLVRARRFLRHHGGGFDSVETELACTGERNWTRTSNAADIGIRCCSDPTF